SVYRNRRTVRVASAKVCRKDQRSAGGIDLREECIRVLKVRIAAQVGPICVNGGEVERVRGSDNVRIAGRIQSDAVRDVVTASAQVGRIEESRTCSIHFQHESVAFAMLR